MACPVVNPRIQREHFCVDNDSTCSSFSHFPHVIRLDSLISIPQSSQMNYYFIFDPYFYIWPRELSLLWRFSGLKWAEGKYSLIS